MSIGAAPLSASASSAQSTDGHTGQAGAADEIPIPPEGVSFAARLFDGARRGDLALFEQVLAYNAGIKDLRNDKGDTLIMLASYHGHPALTRLLLQHGADPNILNDRSQSPLAGAIFKGEKDVVEALLEGGADPGVGEPSAREAVKIFRQEAVWGDRMGLE